MNPGIHDLSAEQYHADPSDTPSLSASIANVLLTHSPAHARAAHPKLNPTYARKEEQKFDVGTAAHALLLQGVSVVDICDYPDWRSGAAKEARDLARTHGRIPLLTDQWTEVEAMTTSVSAQLAALNIEPPLFTAGQPEQTLVWDENGVACRARLDWLHDDHGCIDDLKTTSRSANPETWCRSTLWSIGADVQAAFYTRGLTAVTGAFVPATFRWAVCETTPPYAVSVISLSPAALELANAKVDYALALWKRCLETDTWPGYPTDICFAEPLPWMEAQWLEREAREEMAA